MGEAIATTGGAVDGLPIWLTILLFGLQLLMGLLVTLLGFFMKSLVGSIKDIVGDMKTLATELKEFQLNVAHTGVMREHFEQYRQETRQRLHDIGDRAAAAEGAANIVRGLVTDMLNRPRSSDPHTPHR